MSQILIITKLFIEIIIKLAFENLTKLQFHKDKIA